MNIIKHVAVPAQPTQTYEIQERRITRAGTTLSTTGAFGTRDRDGGMRVFAAMVAARPDRYAPGSGFRLVMKAGDR